MKFVIGVEFIFKILSTGDTESLGIFGWYDLSPVVCHLSLTPSATGTATATHPPPANSPTIHMAQ